MTKIWGLLILTVVFNTPVSAETYSYPLENIESIRISAGIGFEVRCGEVSKLEVTAAAEDRYKLSIDNDTLSLSGKNQNKWFSMLWGNVDDVKASITLNKSPQKERPPVDGYFLCSC